MRLFCYLFPLFILIWLVLQDSHNSDACYQTTIYVQNETAINTTGWTNYALYKTRTMDVNKSNPEIQFGDKIFIPNPKQDCICGGVGLVEKIQDTNYTANEISDEPEMFTLRTLAKAKDLGINHTEDYRFFLAKLDIYIMENAKPVTCGGTLINAKFILTAAHCLCGTFLECLSTDSIRTIRDDKNFFDRKKAYPGLDIFIGFVRGNPAAVSGENPILARRIIIHELYYQDNDLIGPMDVALVETKISIERGSAIQPICLPPPEINNVEALENFVKFEDLDCKRSFDESPIPFVKLGSEILVCRPDRRLSIINNFPPYDPDATIGDTRDGWGDNCYTNLFGPLRGGKCSADCRFDNSIYTTVSQECTRMIEKSKKLGIEKVATIFSDGNNDCFLPTNFTQVQNPSSFQRNTFGWCAGCSMDERSAPCASGSNSDKLCCVNKMSLNEDHVRFGFCDKRCWQDIISNEKDNRFMESQAQTFPRSTFNENICEVSDDEFCTGTQSGPFIKAAFDKNGEFLALENKKIRNDFPKEFKSKCFGEFGGPVWHNSTIDFKSFARKFAILTGVTSRNEYRCSINFPPNELMDVTMHTRVRPILDWILSKSENGKCGDRSELAKIP